MQGEGPFEGPVPYSHHDVVDGGLAEHVVHLVRGVAGQADPVHLQDLVAEPEAPDGGGAALGDQADEHALVDGLHPQANLAIRVLAEDDLPDPMGHLHI